MHNKGSDELESNDSAVGSPMGTGKENSDQTSSGDKYPNWDIGEWVDPNYAYDKEDALEYITSETKGLRNELQLKVNTNDVSPVIESLNVETLANVDDTWI